MTETEWLNSTDPKLMLEFLTGRAKEWLSGRDPSRLDFLHGMGSDRKLQLFACACRWRKNADGCFLYADEPHVDEERVLAVVDGGVFQEAFSLLLFPEALDATAFFGVGMASSDAIYVERNWHGKAAEEAEQGRQVSLLFDIFGNPFRQVSVQREWITTAVVSLAQKIYDERAFARMPELGDALEEAGCTSKELLDHCRGPEPHVRGCWVIDLLLGKE